MHFRPNYFPYMYEQQQNFQPYAPHPNLVQQESSYSPSYHEPVYQTPYEYFQKPEQPPNWPISGKGETNPYPSANENSNMNQPFSMNGFPPYTPPKPNVLNHFQKEDGQLDLDKVLSTVGQLANTYHQVYPIIQQVNGLLKAFRTGG